MKIEKINDNQIRCTLSKKELEERQIKISELAYGSEKAKDLFHDMIEQANDEFGFEVNDMPIMVEAIPLTGENLILQITKVEYPEELDPRFSKFSESDDGWGSEENFINPFADIRGADDILALFKELEREDDSRAENEEGEKKESVIRPMEEADLIRMFEVTKFRELERLSHVLAGYYKGKNTLYKDLHKNRYYLVIQKNQHTPQEFNKICNIISEYAYAKEYTPAVGAYLKEHGKVIIKDKAIQLYGELA
uniref:adaptor protein MecA n=1 Tax=Agathobacter sp. TaxID=2021311 RepID=UPI0040564697